MSGGLNAAILARLQDVRLVPDAARTLEALVAVAGLDPGIEARKATLLIYLADRLHLHRRMAPITRDLYFAADDGPMGAVAMHLIQGCDAALAAAGGTRRPFATRDVDGTRYLVGATRPPDARLLGRSALATIASIVRQGSAVPPEDVALLARAGRDWRRAAGSGADRRMDYGLMPSGWAGIPAAVAIMGMRRSAR